MKDSESMAVGVVVERRKVDNPWVDYAWRSVAVIPGAPRVEEWRTLQAGTDWVHYHIDTLALELFPKETEGYRYNLSNDPPIVYIVLRQGEEAEDREVEVLLVTVCPYEAQDYLDGDDDQVDVVAMPDSVVAWVASFVERHHVDEPFKKRKRKRWTEDASAGGAPRLARGRGTGGNV